MLTTVLVFLVSSYIYIVVRARYICIIYKVYLCDVHIVRR